MRLADTDPIEHNRRLRIVDQARWDDLTQGETAELVGISRTALIGWARKHFVELPAAGRYGVPRKTHCMRGHPFDEANTYIAPGTGWRACHTCRRERNRRRRAAEHAAEATVGNHRAQALAKTLRGAA